MMMMRLLSMITTTTMATTTTMTTAFQYSRSLSSSLSSSSTTTKALSVVSEELVGKNEKIYHVAIIGGGITGSCAASILTSFHYNRRRKSNNNNNMNLIEPFWDTNSIYNNDNNNDDDDDIANYGNNIHVDLFDQGRSGIGGRTSHRKKIITTSNSNSNSNNNCKQQVRFDHGCQFFRADTPQFQNIISNWLSKDIHLIQEWKGNFISSSYTNANNVNNHENNNNNDFFGLPSKPPFYVGIDGMSSISNGLLQHLQQCLNHNSNNDDNDTNDSKSKEEEEDDDNDEEEESKPLNIFTGTRVTQLQRDDQTNKWFLYGTKGIAAYHDTPKNDIHLQNNNNSNNDNNDVLLGSNQGQTYGYDAVILTDASSSTFDKWHRASSGVPEEFACKVRERVGSRVPLFTAMIAFDRESNIPFDAASFDFESNDTLWFAAKMNSKPMINNNNNNNSNNNNNEALVNECWTLVSTPEYAMKKIEETPMQSESGEFIPQSKDYLSTIPGPDLKHAFLKEITSKNGILGDDAIQDHDLPPIIFLDAQRWGSAMPSHRHLNDDSETRKVIAGVPYDSGRSSLAPTRLEVQGENETESFLSDESLMLFQAGDMVSSYTPGFEGAAISGIDAAKSVLRCLHNRHKQ